MFPSVRWVPVTASDAVASARLRAYRPAAALADAGWDSSVTRSQWLGRADVVVFQKAYTDRHLRAAKRLHLRGSMVVLDLCDNHFWAANEVPALAARAERLRRMIDVADLVTVSTPELAMLVDHPEVHVVDDALEPVQPLR